MAAALLVCPRVPPEPPYPRAPPAMTHLALVSEPLLPRQRLARGPGRAVRAGGPSRLGQVSPKVARQPLVDGGLVGGGGGAVAGLERHGVVRRPLLLLPLRLLPTAAAAAATGHLETEGEGPGGVLEDGPDLDIAGPLVV